MKKFLTALAIMILIAGTVFASDTTSPAGISLPTVSDEVYQKVVVGDIIISEAVTVTTGEAVTVTTGQAVTVTSEAFSQI